MGGSGRASTSMKLVAGETLVTGAGVIGVDVGIMGVAAGVDKLVVWTVID